MFRVGATLGSWSRALRAHVADHSGDMEIVLVRDLRAATTSGLSVLCVELSTVWLSPVVIDELAGAGVTVVGMFTDPAEEQQWVAWGVEHHLSVHTAAEHMAFLLASLRPITAASSVEGSDAGLAPPVPEPSGGGGGLVVVGGPAGSGAREVAVGLADRWSQTGTTVVVDCDETGGSVAARLGYAEHPNLLSNAEDVSGLVSAPLPGAGRVGFDVVAGLPSAAEWTEVSPAGVQYLLGVCASRWSTVVAVTGPVVEDLRRWVDRYGVSRTLIGSAPVVVGVCAASPAGVLAFSSWLGATKPRTRVQVVVNKVPSGSWFVRGEVVDRLRSLCGDRIEVVGALAWDRQVMRAQWDGVVVRRGRFARGLRTVAADVRLDHHAAVTQ